LDPLQLLASHQAIKWIDQDSGFPEVARPIFFLLHGQGENMLGRDVIQRSFEALDAIRSVEGYDPFCRPSFDNYGLNKKTACEITSVTALFWNHSVDIFNDQVKTDDDVNKAMSAPNYPDGTPVSKAFAMGYSKKGEKSSTFYSVISFITRIDFPNNANVESMEDKAPNAIQATPTSRLIVVWFETGVVTKLLLPRARRVAQGPSECKQNDVMR
jgi:hypothetical protein